MADCSGVRGLAGVPGLGCRLCHLAQRERGSAGLDLHRRHDGLCGLGGLRLQEIEALKLRGGVSRLNKSGRMRV